MSGAADLYLRGAHVHMVGTLRAGELTGGWKALLQAGCVMGAPLYAASIIGAI